MLKISRLFEHSDDSAYSFKDLVGVIPPLDPPPHGSDKHREDIESVVHSYSNPCLKSGFLDTSHKSAKDIFKKYCSESGYSVDWKKIKKLMKLLKKVNHSLKEKYQRPRPKHILCNYSDKYESINDMDSYSYPSGHTSQAYFIAGLISKLYPEARSDLESIARLIGQSRIENAVHYPSDVSYGRLVGEICADFCNEKIEPKKRNQKSDREFANKIRAYKSTPRLSAESISNFLMRTLDIEGLSSEFSHAECFDAAKNLLTGMPDEYLSSNAFLRSQCQALREAYFLNQYSAENSLRIHSQFSSKDLESGSPGKLRNCDHSSPSGIMYCKPEKIYKSLRKIDNCQDPILRHVLFEWIHPFHDGNGRVGRIILCLDLDFDFDKVCSIIDENYIKNLDYFYHNNEIEKYFL